MKMNLILSALLIFFSFVSCVSPPVVEPPSSPQPPVEPSIEEAVVQEEEAADNYTVTKEVYETTFQEIEGLVGELNQIIARRDFNRWLTHLSDEYIRFYSSPEYLTAFSDYPHLRDDGVVLKSIEDYFNLVVVPSRFNARLDEIVFLNERQVIAYTSYEGQKATLYELESSDKNPNGPREWKIAVFSPESQIGS